MLALLNGGFIADTSPVKPRKPALSDVSVTEWRSSVTVNYFL